MAEDVEVPGELDLLVVGSGVAGLSAAVRAATVAGMRTGLVTKGDLDDATTRWAQGGVAAALGAGTEAVDAHLADTIAAGAGLCDPDAVRVLVDEGPARVEELMALGAVFDRDPQGRLELAREGGHSVARVLHAGGAATGVEIERALIEAVRSTAVLLDTGTFLEDLVVADGRCAGAICLGSDGLRRTIPARNVLLAAGGAGQLFSVTTNPRGSTGDGVAAAIRAGAEVADLEFVQFHPTALRHDLSPRPLLTEALRGHGAVLRGLDGERFVDELAPRDVVSRAIFEQMSSSGADHVWLDARELEAFGTRFPTIAAVLESVGLDPAVDLLPVHPAAHHLCGGVLTDLDGATSLDGLWACGEVACTGVHGANRLASNSLLEGMVFAPRAVEAIAAGRTGRRRSGAVSATGEVPLWHLQGWSPPSLGAPGGPVRSSGTLLGELQQHMTDGAGVRRTAGSLAAVSGALAEIAAATGRPGQGGSGEAVGERVQRHELANLLLVAAALVAAATAREESRGTHWREDHPAADPGWRRRIVLRRHD